MSVVTLSSKYQIVVPREIRERLRLKPGQRLLIIEKNGVIHLIPQRPIREMRGFVKGLDVEGLREEGDRI